MGIMPGHIHKPGNIGECVYVLYRASEVYVLYRASEACVLYRASEVYVLYRASEVCVLVYGVERVSTGCFCSQVLCHDRVL